MIDPNDADTLDPDDFDTIDPSVDDDGSNAIKPDDHEKLDADGTRKTVDAEVTFDPNETWDEGP